METAEEVDINALFTLYSAVETQEKAETVPKVDTLCIFIEKVDVRLF